MKENESGTNSELTAAAKCICVNVALHSPKHKAYI